MQAADANLAISPKGIIAATWISGYGTSKNSVYVRTVSTSNAVGAPHLLASAPYIVQADTALDATGRTFTIMCIGSCDDFASSFRVRAIPYGGSPGATTTVTNSSHSGGAVALVPSLGKFRIVWNSGAKDLTKIGP
ncbi:hypothetical protein EFL95_07570 [Nocardioides marmorisolisilvae]|uniref:Uncharacterized protein n=1 Tax=Nocardioides marmorisolisilvae TaxID=1542737 RepID=A0A3N0DTT5_9ACTN|nr:hypothetical protein EFL95_07570 [Nocardioides marmorisolisilvae]